MSDISGDDLSRLVRELLKKTETIRNRDQYTAGKESAKRRESRPSTALVVIPGSGATDDSIYGGDPRNSYREIRRYLLDNGIDSRVFSFGTIPVPAAIFKRNEVPTVAIGVGSLDNCFFFELRKVVESSTFGDKVNALIIMFRVFFEGGQDSTNFWVQAVLNHHHNAVLETNELYKKTIIPVLRSGQWAQPTAGRETTRVSYFEKRFTSAMAFKHEFNKMYISFRSQGMRGNNMEPHS